MRHKIRALKLMQSILTGDIQSSNGRRLIRLLGWELRKHNLSMLDLGMTERVLNGGHASHKGGLGRATANKRPVKRCLDHG